MMDLYKRICTVSLYTQKADLLECMYVCVLVCVYVYVFVYCEYMMGDGERGRGGERSCRVDAVLRIDLSETAAFTHSHQI